jgi:hypothetical protein
MTKQHLSGFVSTKTSRPHTIYHKNEWQHKHGQCDSRVNIDNKLFLYSKIIKTNYIIEPFIENSNFENRKLIMKMRISDHVLEIERGRYNTINGEQRICRQCHLNTRDTSSFIAKKTNY